MSVQQAARKTVLTILGCGSGGHVLGCLAGANSGVEVRMLTRREDIFKDKTITVNRPGYMGGPSVLGQVDVVSGSAEEMIPGSDIVIWCGPVTATRDALEMVAEVLPLCGDKVPYVGTLFSQGCVHLLAQQVLGKEVPFFALQNIPWLCRTVEPGKVAEIVGNKEYVQVAVNHKAEFTYLEKALAPCFGAYHPDTEGFEGPKLKRLPDFAAIVLNPANQIIHPARMWGIFKDWDGTSAIEKDSIPWLYRDFCDDSALALEHLDSELQLIKRTLEAECAILDVSNCIPLKKRIIAQYGDQVADKSNMKTVMATNQAYSMAMCPVLPHGDGVVPNAEHRVVTDDIAHGLVPLKDIASMLGLKTPWMDKMIKWSQELMGVEFLVDGELTGKDMNLCTSLRELGGTDLSNIGFTEVPYTPAKFVGTLPVHLTNKTIKIGADDGVRPDIHPSTVGSEPL